VKVADRTSIYSSQINSEETPNYIASNQLSMRGLKKIERKNESQDTLPLAITFESADKIRQNYVKDNWDGKITNAATIPIHNIPQHIVLNFAETLKRERTVETQNPER
jgi:hypothetical protein